MKFDLSGISRLVFQIEDALKVADSDAAKALKVNAFNIKRDWQEPLKGSATVPGGAAAVTFDVEVGVGAGRAEIGPELRGQGPIVGMLEYGTPNTGPRGYGAAALQKNVEDLERGLSKAVGDAF